MNGILRRGDKVIATGRKLEKLEHLEDLGAVIMQLDITDKQQSINDTVAKATGIYGRIDVLVNNAGFISIGTWEDLEYGLLLAFLNAFQFSNIEIDTNSFSHSLIRMCLAQSR